MDSTKSKVVIKVSSLIRDCNWNEVVKPIGNRVNKAYPGGNLSTGITIWTEHGPRTFEVRVKEIK